jgi:GAF domain-containing protein/ActR/RegA family two-component response regulator
MPEKRNSRLLEEIRALRARVAQLDHEAAASGQVREASEAFNRVARDLAGTLDVAQATDRVVTTVLQLFRVRLAVLYQLDPASGSLTCIASAGDAGAQQWIGRSLPRGAGVAGLAIAQGRPIWSPNFLLDPRITVPEWVVERIREGGYRAAAGVPLMAQGAMLGALLLADTHGRVFTEADLRLLSAFADQAALALENARLYSEADRRRRKAEFVAELARMINTSLDMDTVLRRIVEGATGFCDSDSAWIALRDSESNAVVRRYWVGARFEGYEEPGRVEVGKGLGGQVLLTGRPQRTDDYIKDPRISKDYLGTAGVEENTAIIVVPIRGDGRAEGLLYVARHSDRPFTDREETVLLQLADHAAIAITNAKLLSREQQARAEAETSEWRFRGLVQGLDAIVWEADFPVENVAGQPTSPRIFRFVSDRAEALLGYPVARWLSEPDFWVSIIHPDDRERVVAACRAGAEEYFQLEYRVVTAARQGIWLQDIIHVLRDSKECARKRFGLMVDITELKRAQQGKALQFAVTEVLAESVTLGEAVQKLLQAVCESLDLDLGELWLVDRSANLLRLGGMWHTPAVDAAEFEAISRDTTFALGAGLPGRVWATGQAAWIPNVAQDPDFLRASLAAREGLQTAFASPLTTNGSVTGVMVGFSRDVRPPDHETLKMVADICGQIGQFAERRRAEEALRQNEQYLRQAQKMESVGRLAGGIAHDFANFLVVIVLDADAILTELAETDPIRGQIEAIKEAAEQATALIRQLMAFGSKQLLWPKVLDLGLVVADMGALLRRLIGEDIHLTIVRAPGLGRVKADPGQLQQVLMNLAANARDAMPRGGQLTIAPANVELDQAFAGQHPGVRPGPYVMLEVQDTGSGMDAETLVHVFEPFFSTKEAGSGAGLGLSTVYGIVKQHNGCIAVDSEVGRGTTFRVFFPRVEDAIEPVEEARLRPGTARGSETILLVDDDVGIRHVLARILSGSAYTVLEAADGAEALLVSERYARPIHLLLTDVVMPGMRGPEVAMHLTALRPDMKVVYISGYVGDALSPRGVVDTGAVVLEKPFTGATLLGKVREALDARGSDERA